MELKGRSFLLLHGHSAAAAVAGGGLNLGFWDDVKWTTERDGWWGLGSKTGKGVE